MFICPLMESGKGSVLPEAKKNKLVKRAFNKETIKMGFVHSCGDGGGKFLVYPM